MNIKTIRNVGLVSGLVVVMVVAIGMFAAFMVSSIPDFVFSSAPSGIKAGFGTATTTEVGPDETITIFNGENSSGVPKQCSSRVINTTDGTGVGITFLLGDPTNGDLASTTLSAVNGQWHAGSTTKAYDSGLFGCERWTAYATASTTVTITEFD